MEFDHHVSSDFSSGFVEFRPTDVRLPLSLPGPLSLAVAPPCLRLLEEGILGNHTRDRLYVDPIWLHVRRTALLTLAAPLRSSVEPVPSSLQSGGLCWDKHSLVRAGWEDNRC
jgi:hypothetical protein